MIGIRPTLSTWELCQALLRRRHIREGQSAAPPKKFAILTIAAGISLCPPFYLVIRQREATLTIFPTSA
jgi:hypothetical protein